MPALRIFVSHSAKSKSARGFLDRVVASLRAAGHMVLVDKDGIELGADWRSTINAWIGGCDVAVVLLSQDALTSTYVLYENSIMAYRKENDPSFVLLPVIRNPVDFKQLEKSQLGTTMIQRWQFAKPEEPNNKVIARLCKRLETAKPVATPLDRAAGKVRALLDRAALSDADMTRQLGELAERGAELRPWIPGEDLATKLAVTMLAAGLAASVDFIRDIREYLTTDEVRNLIDLLACSWVDYRSIKCVPEAALDDRVLGLNADDPVTARMYVIRAAIEHRNLSPRNSWPFAHVHALPTPVDNPADMDLPADAWRARELRQQIVSSLAQRLEGAQPEDIPEWLKTMRREREPVFVALPASGLTSDVLRELRRSLEGVSLFLLTGSESLSPDLALDATVIDPRLELGAEARFLHLYKDKREYLTQRFTFTAAD